MKFTEWFLLALIITGTLHIKHVVTSKIGLGLTADSFWYLSTAINFIHEHTLNLSVSISGLSYFLPVFCHWPPGYPALLSLCIKLGLTALEAAIFLSYLLLAIESFLLYLNVKRMNLPCWLNLTAVALFASCHGVIICHSIAWSEQLFMVVFLLYFLLSDMAIETGNKPVLIATLATAAILPLIRYPGFLIFLNTTYLIILLHKTHAAASHPKHAVLNMLKRIMIPITILAIPSMLWFCRNYALTGHLTGERHNRTVTSLAGAFREIISTLHGEIIPLDHLPDWLSLPVIGATILLISLLVHSFTIKQSPTITRLPFNKTIYGVAYMILLLFCRTTTTIDPLQTRLLLPVLVLVLMGCIARLGRITHPRKVIYLAVSLWVLIGGNIAANILTTIPPKTIYFTTSNEIESSSLCQVASIIPEDVPILSNQCWILNIALSRPVECLPQLQSEQALAEYLFRDSYAGAIIIDFSESSSFRIKSENRVFEDLCRRYPEQLKRYYEEDEGVLYRIEIKLDD